MRSYSSFLTRFAKSQSLIYTMGADALAPYILTTSALIVRNVLVCLESDSHNLWIVKESENANIFSHLLP